MFCDSYVNVTIHFRMRQRKDKLFIKPNLYQDCVVIVSFPVPFRSFIMFTFVHNISNIWTKAKFYGRA